MKLLILILEITLSILWLQVTSCNKQSQSPMIRMKGSGDKMELVFFYKKNTSYEEKKFFHDNILNLPDQSGKGYSFPDGVSAQTFVRISDYEGYAIEFYSNVPAEQRQRLKKTIEEYPIIYRVYENVVPNEIKDLDKYVQVKPNNFK